MSATFAGTAKNGVAGRRAVENKDHAIDRVNDVSVTRNVDATPQTHSWTILATGAVVPLGLAGAASATSYFSSHERVAMTAWIAVAIVGTASVISAAAVSRRRHVSVDRDHDRERHVGPHESDLRTSAE